MGYGFATISSWVISGGVLHWLGCEAKWSLIGTNRELCFEGTDMSSNQFVSVAQLSIIA
jgi:hypothetical protein